MKKDNVFLCVMFIIFCVIGGGAWLLLRGPLCPWINHEALRLNSPDGKVDAVYIQRNVGAMTSVRHSVYVVPKGENPWKKDTAIFIGFRVWDLKITWESDRKLLIQTREGTVNHIQNDIYPFFINKKYKIDIVLDRSGKEND